MGSSFKENNGVWFLITDGVRQVRRTGCEGQVLGKRGFAHEVHEMLLGNNGRDRLRIIH